jgi:hypothetical protein
MQLISRFWVLFPVLFSGMVSATPITLSSSTFSVTYDDSLLGAFGTPTLAGNTLFFSPTTYKTQSLNGTGTSTFSQTLNLTITPFSGFSLDSLSLDEKGDYILRGDSSAVSAGGTMHAENSLNALQFINGSILTTSAMNLTGTSNHPWEAVSSLAFDSSWDFVDSVDLNLTNILSATTGAGTGLRLAFIEKKFVGLTIDTKSTVAEIPESGTLSLTSLGLGAIALRYRYGRKKGLSGNPTQTIVTV